MLTESFITTVVAGSTRHSSSLFPKDAGIFLHDYQPVPAIKGTFKKSSAKPNCFACTSTHIFTSQSDKALIHVYSRERGNQETIVPFPEQITSITRVGAEDSAATLALGTQGGRILLWELATGRLVSTPPSHLQPITSLAADVTHNFLLSGSADSEIHVYALPRLLSFVDPPSGDGSSRYSPLQHFGIHRGAITSIVTGHSYSTADIAVSASEDNTCLVWDYRRGSLLHTFLLPNTPLCVALDPADRAFYTGLSDGSVQMVRLHDPTSATHPIYDDNMAATPTQPAGDDRWTRSVMGTEAASPVLCIDVSYDGTSVLTGHADSRVLGWEVGLGGHASVVADLGGAGAVTNLRMLRPTGWPKEKRYWSGVRLINVVKPKTEMGMSQEVAGAGPGLFVPEGYTFAANFDEEVALPRFRGKHGEDLLMNDFKDMLAEPGFATEEIEDAMREIAAGQGGTVGMNGAGSADGSTGEPEDLVRLRARLEIAEAQRRAYAEKLIEANAEIDKRDKLERMKRRAKSVRRVKEAKMREKEREKYMRRIAPGNRRNGSAEDEDEDMAEESGTQDVHLDGELSSDTDELTASES